MIIDKITKGYQTLTIHPSDNWTDDDVYVVPDGSELAGKIALNFPYYDFVVVDGELIDITPTERPPLPPPPPTQEEINAMLLLEIAMLKGGL